MKIILKIKLLNYNELYLLIIFPLFKMYLKNLILNKLRLLINILKDIKIITFFLMIFFLKNLIIFLLY